LHLPAGICTKPARNGDRRNAPFTRRAVACHTDRTNRIFKHVRRRDEAQSPSGEHVYGQRSIAGTPMRTALHIPLLRSLLPSRVGSVLVVLALLVPAAISWASSVVTYSAVGQTMLNLQSASNATTASRDYNRVYRPTGFTFDLAYLNADGSNQSATHSNAISNPFVDPTGSAFLARAWCRNNSGSTVSPVTCQTTKP
jgi:hypothetical protein